MGRVTWRRRLAAVGLAIALAAAGASAGCGTADPAPQGPRRDWALPNADAANTRNVPSPIDRSTVGDLDVAWTAPIDGLASTPAVVDDVVYVQDLKSNVFALDLADGERRWERRYDERTIGPNGLTVADGRVYGVTTTSAFALDARTGRELWRRTDLVVNDHEGIDMAPGFHDGTVFVSTVPSRPDVQYGSGVRPFLWALDAVTGRTCWRWAQVPADLWGDPATNSGGGLWHPPAFDGEGHVFGAIGNPAPLPGVRGEPWGASRPGPNRWTNSIVKLDERTGRLLWGRQVLPHDVFDWDLQGPVILTRVRDRDVALVAGKMGFVFAFDADTGTPLWKRSVGRHNGLDDFNLKAMRGEADPPLPLTVFPGLLGGVLTQMAIDGTSVYVPVNNLRTVVQSEERILVEHSSGGSGQVVALDLATGRVRWDRRLPGAEYGGATVTNDLVFTTTYEGTLWALDARTGEIAWKDQLPAGSNAPVAIVGNTVIAAAGLVLEKGQETQLVAYRLGG